MTSTALPFPAPAAAGLSPAGSKDKSPPSLCGGALQHSPGLSFSVHGAILILSISSIGHASSLTRDGERIARLVADIPSAPDRLGLVNDGSFEFGRSDEGSAWSCRNDAWDKDRIIEIDISPWRGSQPEVCLKWARCDGNDNLFVNWVTIEDSCETATESSSFSTVKSLY
ncbi:MAG: hypothetical protein GY720_18715 [bacterium]|nr:hypothetical protein [bacterium]